MLIALSDQAPTAGGVPASSVAMINDEQMETGQCLESVPVGTDDKAQASCCG